MENRIRQRIAAGVIVEQEGKVLMVRHRKEGAYDFWVAPGGGALDGEDLIAAAKREAREECGLEVEVGRLLYVEELGQPQLRECKLWFAGRLLGGELDCGAPEAVREHIVEAAWLTREQLAGLTAFPPMLQDCYWQQRDDGPAYVGLRQMAFW